jgi:hypothetical protein
MEMEFSSQGSYRDARFKSILLRDIERDLFENKLTITTKDNKKVQLLLKLTFEGNVKKLQLLHSPKKVEDISQGVFRCKIPYTIISLIGYKDKIRKEIIHVVIEMAELETAKTKEITEYYFKITKLQIENCLQMSPLFPVMLESTVSSNCLFFL